MLKFFQEFFTDAFIYMFFAASFVAEVSRDYDTTGHTLPFILVNNALHYVIALSVCMGFVIYDYIERHYQ